MTLSERDRVGEQEAGAREVLERLRQASVNRSVDDMSRLYAVDAVHEFPFTAPGFPSRLEGRDEIVNWMTALWTTDTLRYERYRTLATYDTDDPETIIVEQEAVGTSASTGEFALPNIVVLTVRKGQIVRLRDYVNVLAAAAAIGRDM
ncbi:nuclear transport factor 2 family protein [Actinopolymorpha pittospori]